MKKALLFLAFLMLFTTCKKSPEETMTVETQEVSGRIELPSGCSVSPSNLTVLSGVGEEDVESDGSFSVVAPVSEGYQLMIVTTSSGNPVLLNYSIHSTEEGTKEEVSFDARSTALALVMINPMFIGMSTEQREEVISKVLATSGFEELVEDVENALINDPEGILDIDKHPKIYERAVNIGIEVLKSYGKTLKGSDDKPWIEDAEGSDIKILNPNCIFYSAAFYPSGSSTWDDFVLLEAKSGLWSYQLGWPPIIVTPPTETFYSLGDGSYSVRIERGAWSNFIYLNWDDPVGRANIMNWAKGILLVIDLGLGIKALSVDYSSLPLEISQDVEKLMYLCIVDRDLWGFVRLFFKVLIDNKDAILNWLYHATVGGKWLQTFATILQNVSVIVKIICTGETAARVAIPFFYDLLTSPVAVNYYVVQDHGVLVTNEENLPPEPPVITYAPSTGVEDEVYSFTAYTSDPDGDNVSYQFVWGDGDSSSWSEYVGSGNEITMSHSYREAGTYNIVVSAKDKNGLVSAPSEVHSIVISPPGNVLYDNFDDDMPNGLPSDPPWTSYWVEPSYLRITDDVHYGSSGNCCAFYDYDESLGDTALYGCYANIYAYIEMPQKGYAEWIWKVKTDEDFFGIRAWEVLGDWYTMGFYLLFENGNISYYTPDGTFVPLMEYVPDTWYRIKVEYDTDAREYDVYINGSLVAADVPYVGYPDSLLVFQVVAFSDASCRAGYVDEIKCAGTVRKIVPKGKVPAEAFMMRRK